MPASNVEAAQMLQSITYSLLKFAIFLGLATFIVVIIALTLDEDLAYRTRHRNTIVIATVMVCMPFLVGVSQIVSANKAPT